MKCEMISNEERIEIARKLREAKNVLTDTDGIWDVLDEILSTREGSDNAPWDYTFDRLANLIEPEHRKCEHCGTVYYPRTKEQRYCSKQCKKDHYITERLEREGEVPEYIAKVYGLEVDCAK